MIIHNLSRENSVLSHFLGEMRDVEIQGDSLRFRRNIERIGEVLAYEISKTLSYSDRDIQTPLGIAPTAWMKDQIVVCSILRAGVPLHVGILNYFDKAENSFISAYRHHKSETEFEVKVEYLASPSLEGKTLILADPMLATGQSFLNVFNALKPLGTPESIHLAAVIGARPGIEFLDEHLPVNTELWIAAIDDELDERGYIVPGLGDAGDLAYGYKKQH